jgi:hypothetical protein
MYSLSLYLQVRMILKRDVTITSLHAQLYKSYFKGAIECAVTVECIDRGVLEIF